MKKITYTIGFAFAMLATSNAIAQQGFGTNRPHKSAAVHIESPNKGLLIPNVALKSDIDNTTIVNPALSLLVYNTSNSNGMRPGYYYNNVDGVSSTKNPKWVPFLDASNNTVTAANGLRMDGNTVKLGGTLTEDTTIITGGKKVKIQGLTAITDMKDHMIAVGHVTEGEVKVASPTTIVTAGIDNDLKLDIYPTGNDKQIVLTSTVNKDAAPVDIKPAIQAGQVKYEVASADKSVIVTPDTTNPDLIKYDLKVANANAAIKVGNGLEKETTNNDRVVLGGTLDKETIINTGTQALHISNLGTADLTQVQGAPDGVSALGEYDVMVVDKNDGELRTTPAGEIVNKGLKQGSGITIIRDATSITTTQVHLGGKIEGKSELITTATDVLAITGLQPSTEEVKSFVTVDADGVLRTTSINAGVEIKTVTDDYSAKHADETILVNTDAAVKKLDPNDTDPNAVKTITITLPDATQFEGKRYNIKSIAKNHRNILIIDSTSAIDGSPLPIESSSPFQSWLLQSDGTGWFVVGY